MTVTVRYTPANTNPWSQTPASKIKVGSGSTTLNWNIQVMPASAGAIVFNTDPNSPGIQFDTDVVWPGTPPSGDANGWSSTINNTLPRGSQAQTFHYVVNALFTPANGTQIQVTYDPDVQEDPPNVVIE